MASSAYKTLLKRIKYKKGRRGPEEGESISSFKFWPNNTDIKFGPHSIEQLSVIFWQICTVCCIQRVIALRTVRHMAATGIIIIIISTQ